jgi:peroxiredoxin-like protein
MNHVFKLKAKWRGGLGGEGKIECGQLETVVSAPKDLGGPGRGTNPEELLLGAASTCYLITLAAILERRQVPFHSLRLESQGEVTTEGGLRYVRITHRPHFEFAESATAENREAARDATLRAEKACLISNAVRGNVEVIVEPILE